MTFHKVIPGFQQFFEYGSFCYFLSLLPLPHNCQECFEFRLYDGDEVSKACAGLNSTSAQIIEYGTGWYLFCDRIFPANRFLKQITYRPFHRQKRIQSPGCEIRGYMQRMRGDRISIVHAGEIEDAYYCISRQLRKWFSIRYWRKNMAASTRKIKVLEKVCASGKRLTFKKAF